MLSAGLGGCPSSERCYQSLAPEEAMTMTTGLRMLVLGRRPSNRSSSADRTAAGVPNRASLS